MVGHDRAGVDGVIRSRGTESETLGDRAGLFARETDGLVFQSALRGSALFRIVIACGEGLSRIDLGGGAEGVEFVSPDEVGP